MLLRKGAGMRYHTFIRAKPVKFAGARPHLKLSATVFDLDDSPIYKIKKMPLKKGADFLAEFIGIKLK